MELKYSTDSRISEVARMFKRTEEQEPQTRLKGKGSPRTYEVHIYANGQQFALKCIQGGFSYLIRKKLFRKPRIHSTKIICLCRLKSHAGK